MAEKYFIANGDQYLTSVGEGTLVVGGPITQAKRFNQESAYSVLSSLTVDHPGWAVQRLFSSRSKKNYVITNANKFVGANGTIVEDISKARSFKTAADADGYLRSHGELLLKMGDTVIINEEYEPVDIWGRKRLSNPCLRKINIVDRGGSTPRVSLSKELKGMVFEQSNGYCAICGKPLTPESYTVDHIVPLSRGGTNEMSNFRCVCKRCNEWKGDSLDGEMVTMLSQVGGYYMYNNPYSDATMRMMRMMLRGVLKNPWTGDTNDNN